MLQNKHGTLKQKIICYGYLYDSIVKLISSWMILNAAITSERIAL
jgi:hypothetical protein